MKKLLFVMLFLGMLGNAWGAIERGKNGSGNQAGGTTIDCTWVGGGSSTENNTIIVAVFNQDDFGRTFTVTDNAAGGSNTYTLDKTYDCPVTTSYFYIYSCLVAKAASTITVTASGYEVFGASIMEYSGIATSLALDKIATIYHNDWTTTGTRWTANGTGTLSQADELVLSVNYETRSHLASFAITGYTVYAIPGQKGGVADKIVSSTDSLTPSGTYTRTGSDACEIYSGVVTYKAVSSGSGAPTSNVIILN